MRHRAIRPIPVAPRQLPSAPATYDPNHLIDALLTKLRLRNDAELCLALDVAPPVLSKIRHRRLAIGAAILIRMQEASHFDLRTLRKLMGDRRRRFRLITRQSASDSEQPRQNLAENVC